jgi:hypothetical protein
MRLLAHIKMRRFATQSEQYFRNDLRYDLDNVTEGFASRLDCSSDDTDLLERICKAYVRTTSHPGPVRECFEPTKWWKELGETLGPVRRALREGDIDALRAMYSNFFRDHCSAGLVGVPYGMAKAYFQGPIRDVHRHCYMGDPLYRIDYWLSQTGGRYGLSDLRGPEVGNPFGVSINGTLVRSGSEYQHYCAHMILSRLDAGRSVVAEIGGGYGGAGYYLLRDGGRLTYIDFDVPESIALASYYLLKALPSLRFLLYGERDLTSEALAAADVVLLPLFEMDRMPAGSLNLTFSSHVLGDLSDSAMAEYLGVITRMTQSHFLYFGESRAAERISNLGGGRLRLLEARSSAWNRHKAPKAPEGEYLYQLGDN